MSKYTVNSRLKHNGEVYEAGDEVQLNDDVAQPLVTAGVVASASKRKGGGQKQPENTQQDTTEEEQQEGDQYDAMAYNDLRNLAKQRGVRADGKKPDIAARLREADNQSDGNEELADNL